MAETDSRPTNFIRQIIDKDINEGLHTKIQTRFHQSQMVIFILAMQNLFVLILVLPKIIKVNVT
jgi:hypothetical protein